DRALTASKDRVAARELAFTAARAADAKGGRDIVVLEVGDVLVVADEFVIVSAPNDRLVRAIVEEVERVVGERGLGKPLRVEGLDAQPCVLLDSRDGIVPVFLAEARAHYALRRAGSELARLRCA